MCRCWQCQVAWVAPCGGYCSSSGAGESLGGVRRGGGSHGGLGALSSPAPVWWMVGRFKTQVQSPTRAHTRVCTHACANTRAHTRTHPDAGSGSSRRLPFPGEKVLRESAIAVRSRTIGRRQPPLIGGKGPAGSRCSVWNVWPASQPRRRWRQQRRPQRCQGI